MMTKITTHVWGLALAGLLITLAGCGASTDPPPTVLPTPPPPPTATRPILSDTPLPTATVASPPATPRQPPPRATSPTPVPATPDLNAPLITYRVHGGIAGSDRLLELFRTDSARLTERGRVLGTFDLPADGLSGLAAMFKAAGFSNLADRYGNGNVADDIYTTITYSPDDGPGKTVTFEQVGGEGLTPQALLSLAASLQAIMDSTPLTRVPLPTLPQPIPPGSTVPAALGTTTPPPASSAEPGAGADLLAYRVQGGRAGLDRAFFVDYRGGAHFYENGAEIRTTALPIEQRTGLLAAISANNFWALADEYPATAAVADQQTTSLTVTDGGRSKTVTVRAGAVDVPAGWTALITYVDNLMVALTPR